MYCNGLRAWWSARSRLAALLSSLVARRWVGLRALWWFRLGDLSVGGMVGAWCFGCLSGPPGFACWISFAPVFGLIYCWVLVLALSRCYVLIYMFWEMVRWWVGGLSCGPGVYVTWSASGLGVRLAPLGRFGPSGEIFYWPFQGGTSFVDLLCFCSVLCLLCFVRVCLCVLCGRLLGGGGGGAGLLANVCGVFCEFVTFPLVSWVRCGTWLYRFLIFATFLLFWSKKCKVRRAFSLEGTFNKINKFIFN